jgi:hypothetical protein
MRQTFCVNCGSGTSKSLDYVELINDETYEGNLQIISKRTTNYDTSVWKSYDNEDDRVLITKRTRLTLWDGESYQPLKYQGRFCKLKCALSFADGAYEAGYRRGK